MKRGISLIVMIITIIIIIIMSSVIIVSINNTNIIKNAKLAKITNDLSSYKEQIELFKQQKYMENQNFMPSTLAVGKNILYYNTKKEQEKGNIKTIVPNIGDKYLDKLEVIKGNLVINTKDTEEIKAAQFIGVKANPYDIIDGELESSNGNLSLMDEKGTLIIPSNVNKIGEGAFANLDGLKKLIIPGTVKVIGERAFANNKTLEEIVFEEGTQTIGYEAFRECSNLKRVKLPETLENLESSVFIYCYNLESIEIPSKISSLKSYSFYKCNNLKNIKLPKNLSKIDSYALAYTGIVEINMPEKLETISEDSFIESNNIERINLVGNANFIYENGMLMTKDKNKILYVSSKVLSEGDTFIIPEGIINFNVSISNYSNIKRLVIPSTLEMFNPLYMPLSIEEVKILNKEGIEPKLIIQDNIVYTKDKKDLIMCYSKEKNIQLLNHIDKIRRYSFKQAVNLENIYIKDCLYIENQVFSDCVNIKKILFGDKVLEIHPVFKSSNYGIIEIDEKNPNLISENGAIYSKDKKTLITVYKNIKGKYVVDSNVENIGDMAFYAKYDLNEVVLPMNLKNIGASFQFCYGIIKIEIPNSIETINSKAFSNSKNLEEIIIHKEKNSIKGSPWGCDIGMRAVKWVNN